MWGISLQAAQILISQRLCSMELTDRTTYLLTPWRRVLLEKLTGLQLVKKFPAFVEPKSPSPYPQVPATCPYPEPTPSSPHDPLQLSEDPS